GLDDAPAFAGEDIWTLYELSWLDLKGKPRVAIATLRIPGDSPSIIESKSLKLYLNGFAASRQPHADALASRLVHDLSACCGATVGIELWEGAAMDAFPTGWLWGESIDDTDIDLALFDEPQPRLLDGSGAVARGGQAIDVATAAANDVADVDINIVEEALVTRLFR